MQQEVDLQPELPSMSLWDHLDELRGRLIKSLMSIAIVFTLAFVFANNIINFLKIPLKAALPPEMKTDLYFTGPMDVFSANMKVAFLVALIFACPIWIYQLWRFIEPALYQRERKYVLPFAVVSILLFFAGMTFCYLVMLPMTLSFLLSYGSEVGTPIITIGDYVSMVSVLLIGFGLIFETPVILLLLGFLGIVDADMLSEQRRIIVIVILIIAAILTPPDPISQIAMAIPMYIMYEASIVLLRFFAKKERHA